MVDDGTGNLALERVAVGDHILLGGDNMDLALAHAAAAAAWAIALAPLQFRALVHACRRAKEQLLAAEAPEQLPVSILGRGQQADRRHRARSTWQREHVRRLVLDGFFPFVDAAPARRSAGATGLHELGLPYAHDPAVTRHLAEFLARHGRAAHRRAVQRRRDEGRAAARRGWPRWSAAGRARGRCPALAGNDLDLAVAHGAAYYGLVRRGRGIRIRGGTARSYYIGIEAAVPAIPGFAPPVKALCVVPFGMEEGTAVKLPDEELGLVVGETAEFRFFAASDAQATRPGRWSIPMRPSWRSWARSRPRCPPIGGAEPGTTVPVSLESRLTEVGTLELWCVARDASGPGQADRWKLEYSVRERS